MAWNQKQHQSIRHGGVTCCIGLCKRDGLISDSVHTIETGKTGASDMLHRTVWTVWEKIETMAGHIAEQWVNYRSKSDNDNGSTNCENG